MKTYCFDVDGTVCSNTKGKYERAEPFQDRIDHINKLYDEGNKIIFFTARGMSRFQGDVKLVHEHYYDFTENQLKGWGIKFHKLFLGKPYYDLFVDDRAISDTEYFKENKSAEKYWDERYTIGLDHHSSQNQQISSDFIREITNDEVKNIYNALKYAKSVIEVGCGTGEFSVEIKKHFNTPLITGTDFSPQSIKFCKEKYENLGINFEVLNILDQDELEKHKKYDLAVCSNVLEHFKDPWTPLNNILSLCRAALILVPHRENLDGRRKEYWEPGHGTHEFSFNEEHFLPYSVIDAVLFATPGWGGGAQMAVLLQGKLK